MLQPNNRVRSSAEIVARLSDADRLFVAERMARIERRLEERRKLADSLLWLLEEPRIQQRIRENFEREEEAHSCKHAARAI